MHGDKAFDDFFKVFPFLLIGVVIAVGVDLDWQAAQFDGEARLLNSLHFDLLVRYRVLNYHHSFIETWLLFENDIGG